MVTVWRCGIQGESRLTKGKDLTFVYDGSRPDGDYVERKRRIERFTATERGRIRSVPIIDIATDRMHDWNTFHDVFSEVLGFPEFYGRNMDAWIDC